MLRKQVELNKTSMIEREVKKQLDKKRFQHTVAVSYLAAAMAMCHGYDIEKARLAGLLHDAAKCIPPERKIYLCNKYNIQMTEVERSYPALLHAKLGAFLAMKKYNVHDDEIISAILNHTTGKPDMGVLDKIIYIADYIEPNRRRAPRLPEIRQMAFRDMDRALVMILEDTLQFLKDNNGAVDPITQKTYDYYIGEQHGGNHGDNIDTNVKTRV